VRRRGHRPRPSPPSAAGPARLITSTAYPPGGRASSAATGTTIALLTLAVVMYTVTGAWSKAPATGEACAWT
jgi:hypothetical protein